MQSARSRSYGKIGDFEQSNLSGDTYEIHWSYLFSKPKNIQVSVKLITCSMVPGSWLSRACHALLKPAGVFLSRRTVIGQQTHWFLYFHWFKINIRYSIICRFAPLSTVRLLSTFEPRSKSYAPGIAGSVMTIGLSINGCSHTENQFDDREQDWLVQSFWLRWLQRLD